MGRTKSVAVELTAEAEALLKQFRDGDSFSARLEALDQLVTAKQIPQAARRGDFESAVLKLAQTASDRQSENQRLIAVSRLGLLAATINLKPMRQKIREVLKSALAQPLAPMQSLGAANDRLYVAQACAIAAHAWCPEYLSDSAILEETGENTRAECIRALAEQLGDLQQLFDCLLGSLDKLVPETESPANSTGRRLRRLLAGLRPVISLCRVAPGSEPGRALAEMLRQPLNRHGQPDEPKVIEELAGEAFASIHELVRAGFSLATEPSTYAALRVCHRWFPEHKWQSLTEKSDALQMVVQDLREAVILLAKQNVTDQSLLDLLRVACGSSEKTRSITAPIASVLPGLSTEVRRFLGAEIEPDDDIALNRNPGEISSTSEVMHLADLLVDSEVVYGEAEAELEKGGGQKDEQLRAILGRAMALADSARSLARRHLMELRGRVGEVVEFSQLDHEMAGGFQAGIRRVRIRRPTVIQMRGSLPHVIRKGLVEPV